MGKMAHIAPFGSNKLDYLHKKVNFEHESNNLKGSFCKLAWFACPLYAEVPKISNGSAISCKEFVEIYVFFVEGMSPKMIKIPRNLIVEEVSKRIGLIQNKNGHNYVHSENFVLIAKVERLWMLVHQQTCVPTTRIVSLGFAKGMAMEVEG
jgi:hypothetical protein